MGRCSFVLAINLLLLIVGATSATETESAPRPLPNHPGNIFLSDESVEVPMPGSDDVAWDLTDYEGRSVAHGLVQHGKAQVGRLPVGYYELRRDKAAPVSIGVLAALRSPIPETSAIAIDLAMSWFYFNEADKAAAANLCKLAGVNWVRDRMIWGEIETDRGRFAKSTRYDQSARIESAACLHVLQVNHSTPSWAGENPRHFPEDLRDVYHFSRHVAQHFKGKIQAFEPWNEADIEMFGGHTGAEMASLQKAAYLGLKAGNPDAIACLNVFAIARASTLNDLAANEAWPYFDTCNLHHYCGPDEYPARYAAFRRISAGRPLWVTEFNQPVHWSGDPKLLEPSAADLRVQAERVPILLASSLFEGPAKAFYFLFPHYAEGQVQFGIVHRDLTPRPAYVALAAAGRLLAEARPIGRWELGDKRARAFFFRVRPDGQDRDLLVAWTNGPPYEITLPAPPAVMDHLGRIVPQQGESLKLGRSPLYALFRSGIANTIHMSRPPAMPEREHASPSPVVLQVLLPPDRILLDESAYRIDPGPSIALPICVYNFADNPVAGQLTMAAVAGWHASPLDRLVLAPGERKKLVLNLRQLVKNAAFPERITVGGDFGSAGKHVRLSFRIRAERKK